MITSSEFFAWARQNQTEIVTMLGEAIPDIPERQVSFNDYETGFISLSMIPMRFFGSGAVHIQFDMNWRDDRLSAFIICGPGEQGNVSVPRNVFAGGDTPKNLLSAVLDFFNDKLRREPSPGCVKAYTSKEKVTWFVKRANSQNVVKIGDDHYMFNSGVYRVFHEDGSVTYCFGADVPDEEGFSLVQRVDEHGREDGVDHYHNSLVEPVYASYNRLLDQTGSVAARLPRERVENNALYRQITRPDGSVIFVSNSGSGILGSRRLTDYDSTPVHGYSVRIENLVGEDELFKLGKLDLYGRRPMAEVPFLGWELEACDNQSEIGANAGAKKIKQLMHKLVMCKTDSSISPRGFETVSIPATLDFWKESNLSSAMNELRTAPYNMRSYEHPSCGFHVHVNRSALSVLDLQKLERFMHCPENRSALEAVAGRQDTTYAKYYPNIFWGKDRGKKKSAYQSFPSEPCSSTDLWSNYGNNDHDHDPLIYFARLTWAHISIEYWRNMGGGFINALNGARVRVGATETTRQLIMSKVPAMYEALALYSGAQDFFKKIIRRCFPDTPFTFMQEAQGEASQQNPAVMEWARKVRRKAEKPVGRRNNYDACRQITGNLGKQAAGRYDVLNTGNKNTVEFRLFKGTMNPTSIFRYLEFVDALVRFVPSTSATDEGLKFERFTNWLQSDSFNVLRYENLIAFLVSNGYIDRKKIRRRELVETVEADGPNLPTEMNDPDEDDEDYEVNEVDDLDEYDEPDDYDDGGCDCPDCQYARGDISQSEYDTLTGNL